MVPFLHTPWEILTTRIFGKVKDLEIRRKKVPQNIDNFTRYGPIKIIVFIFCVFGVLKGKKLSIFFKFRTILIICLWIKMSFGRLIVIWNPLNGHYLYYYYYYYIIIIKNFFPKEIHGDFFSGALEGILIPKN